MKQVSIRISPVIRWNLTRYVSEPDGASVGSVGEFTNKAAAEEVGRALAAQIPGAIFTPDDGETEITPYLQYCIVEQTLGGVEARVWYADYLEEAQQHAAQLRRHFGKQFHIFTRQVTGRIPQERRIGGDFIPLDLSACDQAPAAGGTGKERFIGDTANINVTIDKGPAYTGPRAATGGTAD